MTTTVSPEPALTPQRVESVRAGSVPLRAQQTDSAAEIWSQLHPDIAGPPRFRLQRESEVPKLLATMNQGPSALLGEPGAHRPDQLAGERQERRQIVAIARMVCQATIEVLTGVRPVSQLRKWVASDVHSKVAQRAAIMARHRTGATVRPPKLSFDAERTTHPSTGVWEVSVVFTDTHRTRACAMRLHAHRGRWRVVALELG